MTTINDSAVAPDPSTISDAELIRGMQADDLEMFEAFYTRFRVFVFRTAYGLTGDREFAEEVLQDTFVRAYRNRSSLLADRSPLPWLNRVALNLCYSAHGRRRVPIRPMDDATSDRLRDQQIEPAEWAEQQELCRWVRDGVAALPAKQRSVVVLYYLDGLSLQETSTALKLPLGTVKSRLYYALHALRQQLADDGPVAAERPVAAVLPVERPNRRRRS